MRSKVISSLHRLTFRRFGVRGFGCVETIRTVFIGARVASSPTACNFCPMALGAWGDTGVTPCASMYLSTTLIRQTTCRPPNLHHAGPTRRRRISHNCRFVFSSNMRMN
jgi:hypothetical protein